MYILPCSVYPLQTSHDAGHNVNTMWTPITLYYLGNKNKGKKNPVYRCNNFRYFCG